MFLPEPSVWDQSMFKHAELGDSRRTKHLVQLAGQLAANTGKSIEQALPSHTAIEAAQRFIRNAEAGFKTTVDASYSFDCLLAIEDTTSLQFVHSSAWLMNWR